MATAPFGLNILGSYVRDRNQLVEWIRQAQPAACVLMDEYALVQPIQQASPDTLIVFRAYNPNDARWWEVTTPHDWLAAHIGFAANGVALQVLNEPVLNDAALAWLEQLCAICPAHVTLAMPNFAVGNPHEDDILAGKYDRLLKLVCGTLHVLALHEYFRDDPLLETPWLCGRFTYWERRARVLGLPAPRFIITEHGRDYGGGHGDGWRGQGWSEESYFSRLQDAQEDTYANRIPVCLFCWGTGAHDDWLSFDIQDAPALQQMLIDWNQTHPIQESEPVNQPYIPAPSTGVQGTLDVLPGRYVNIREQPYLDAKDVGDLYKGENVIYSTSAQAPGWAHVERVLDGVKGWVSHQNGAVVFLLSSEPTDPAPTPDTVTLTVADYNAIVASLEDALARLRGGQQPEIPF